MKRKEYHVNRTGNSVSDFREVWVDCENCKGTGEVELYADEPEEAYWDICPDCDGRGGFYIKK